MALMGDIIQLVWDDAQKKEFSTINKIDLLVGVLSQAMPDALDMAFLVYKEQHPNILSKEAVLEIEIEEAVAKCVICEHEYIPDQRITICPGCGVPSGNLLKGESFQVISYEGS